MKNKRKEMNRQKECKVLLTFLERTKEGKYAKIDERALAYAREKYEREDFDLEEDYYYSTR